MGNMPPAEIFNLERELVGRMNLASSASYLQFFGEWTEDEKILFSDQLSINLNFLSENESRALKDEIMGILEGNNNDGGSVFDYGKRIEITSLREENWNVVKRIIAQGFNSNEISMIRLHCLALPENDIILPHPSNAMSPHEPVVGLNLLLPVLFRMYPGSDASRYVNLYIPSNAVYVIRGLGRENFEHSIVPGDTFLFKGIIIRSGIRLILICSKKPNCEEMRANQ